MSLLKSILPPLPGDDRRREPRQAQDCTVTLFKAGRPAGTARLLDVSTGGARLHGLAELIGAADAFVNPMTRTAHQYEVVRTGFGGVGVRITRTQSLTGRVAPAYEAMRRALG